MAPLLKHNRHTEIGGLRQKVSDSTLFVPLCNELRTLNGVLDAVFFAGAEIKFGASEKCNDDSS